MRFVGVVSVSLWMATALGTPAVSLASMWQVDSVYSAAFAYSMDVDAQRRVHIAADTLGPPSGPRLCHFVVAPQGIQIETIDSTRGLSGFPRQVALRLDAQGSPHVAYLRLQGSPPTYLLIHAWRDDSGWSHASIDSFPMGGLGDPRVSMALDEDGVAHIGYLAVDNFGNGVLRYATSSHGSIAIENLTLPGGPFHPLSDVAICVDASGYARLGFVDNGVVRYARDLGSFGWGIDSVGVAWGATYLSMISLSLDAAGQPHMGFTDDGGRYVHAFKGASAWSSETLLNGSESAVGTLVLDSQDGPRALLSSGSIALNLEFLDHMTRRPDGRWHRHRVYAWDGNLSLGVMFSQFTTDAGGGSHIVLGLFGDDQASPDSTELRHLTSALDTDGDGLFDDWETEGIDSDEDGDVDYMPPGADPRHKDVYVELDAMVGRAPSQDALEMVVDAYDAAPVQNPDLVSGIHLHFIGQGCDPCVDDASLGLAPWPANPWPAFMTLKSQSFGTSSERLSPNSAAILEAKSSVVRYGIFADRQGTTKTSGLARWPFPNLDFMVTLGAWTDVTDEDQAGTLMHELGHCLGLRHGGTDGFNHKPNYYSVMNYAWQTRNRVTETGARGLLQQTLRDSWTLDYSRAALPTLTIFGGYDEPDGVGGSEGLYVRVGTQQAFEPPQPLPSVVRMAGPVDWNRDGDFTDLGVPACGNLLPGLNETCDEPLHGAEDWSRLVYAPYRSIVATAAAPRINDEEERELTFDDVIAMAEMRYDCNGNGIFDDVEIDSMGMPDLDANGIPDPCEPIVLAASSPTSRHHPALRILGSPVRRARSVRFEIDIAVGGPVRLEVFEVSGRRVSTVLGGTLPPGLHRVDWTAIDRAGHRLSSGVYFARLESGGERAVLRFALLE